MTTCFGKSCLFGLLCVSIMNVYQLVYVCFFPFWFWGLGVGFNCISSRLLPTFLLCRWAKLVTVLNQFYLIQRDLDYNVVVCNLISDLVTTAWTWRGFVLPDFHFPWLCHRMLIHGAVWGDMRMMLSARGHLVAIFYLCVREGRDKRVHVWVGVFRICRYLYEFS